MNPPRDIDKKTKPGYENKEKEKGERDSPNIKVISLALRILADVPAQLIVVVPEQATLHVALPDTEDAIFLEAVHQAKGVIGGKVVEVKAVSGVIADLFSQSVEQEKNRGTNETYNNQGISSMIPVRSLLAVEEVNDLFVAASPHGRSVRLGVQALGLTLVQL